MRLPPSSIAVSRVRGRSGFAHRVAPAAATPTLHGRFTRSRKALRGGVFGVVLSCTGGTASVWSRVQWRCRALADIGLLCRGLFASRRRARATAEPHRRGARTPLTGKGGGAVM